MTSMGSPFPPSPLAHPSGRDVSAALELKEPPVVAICNMGHQHEVAPATYKLPGEIDFPIPALECGAGWLPLVEPLIAMCKEAKVPILQIKEKWGTLRFYVGAVIDPEAENKEKVDALFKAIIATENASKSVCESCGAAGTRTDPKRAWVKTLCPVHMEEWYAQTDKARARANENLRNE
jgi:hypothetical protein